MSTQVKPRIHEEWLEWLKPEFESKYFQELKLFLQSEKATHRIYPKGKDIFRAFDLTPPEKVKVVIIGQDPYHGPGQAHGLCFSVQKGIKPPPSLVNIFKELTADLDLPIPNHGDLSSWAEQGVLLLNATLTVREREPGSHQNKGWERFTDAVIKSISEKKKNVVFLLWGRFAQNKAQLVDASQHFVLKAAHPSPFSARNGFFGCNHFSETNKLLAAKNKTPINWDISGS